MVSEALQQFFMATKFVCPSSLPWIWVIEALASSSEIDTSLLINLLKRTPEISDDQGRNAREMVSLRVLESLFVRKNSDANSVASVSDEKVELDPSRDCEDVLRCILLEVSASNLKTATPDMLKWDVLSFIMKKRSILPKCHLQQFKDAIVKSTNPFSSSLKERSGLELGNHYRDSVTADAIDSDGFNQGHEIGGVNTRSAAPTENLDTSTQGNKNGLQENQPGSTLLPVKRSFNAPSAYEIEVNKTKATPEKSSDPCAKAAKKFKQDVAGPIQNTVPDLISSQRDGVPAESCGGSQSIVQKRNSEDDGTLKANGCLKDGKAKHAASASVLCGIDFSIKDLLPQRMSLDKKFQNIGSSSNCCAELGTSNDLSRRVIQQDSRTCGSKGDMDYNLPQDLQNGEPFNADKESIKQSCESEFSGDTDKYHNESTDLASQKNDFLNVQYAQGEDSLATVDCTELNLCVKCTEGGNLLVCSSDTCSLVVHESCLGSVSNFDYKGSFYCPFCTYSRAISENLEGKKKVSLAQNDLAAFIGVGAGQQSKKSLPRSQGMKKHQYQEDRIVQLWRNVKGNNSLNEVTKAGSAPADKSSVGAQVMQTSAPQPEPSLPRNENERNSLNEVTEAGSAPVDRSSVRAQVMQTVAPQPETSLPRNESGRNSLNEVREEEELCHDENRNKNSLEKAGDARSRPVTRNSMRAKVTQIHPPQPHVPHEYVCLESSEEEQDEIGSGYHVQSRNQENNPCPWISKLRRKKLPWTKMEEKTLKAGFLRFSHFHDRWKRILEFGGDVFLKGRTAGDLKDKWRNIGRASKKAT